MTVSGFLSRSASLLCFFAALLQPLANASDCDQCDKQAQLLAKLENNKEQTISLLGKNQDYLAVLSAKEASKFLKVQSNIKIILEKLDAIKAQLAEEQKNFEKNGCSACKK